MFAFLKKRETSPQYLKFDGQNAYFVRIATAKHGEVVQIRFTRSGDISSDEKGFYVRKGIVAPNSFDRATLEVRFSSGYAKPIVTVEGGEAIPVSEWKD
ncbi:MAG: hypothetical protein ACK41E_06235 [Deinococcales bacterium]